MLKAELNVIDTKKTITQINETESWFFQKINKISKPVSRFIKKKNKINGRRAQINKIKIQ